jgi:hypothetical protein
LNSPHIQRLNRLPLRFIPSMTRPLDNSPGEVSGKCHDRVIGGLRIRQPEDERVPEVMQAAFRLGQLPASTRTGCPSWF